MVREQTISFFFCFVALGYILNFTPTANGQNNSSGKDSSNIIQEKKIDTTDILIKEVDKLFVEGDFTNALNLAVKVQGLCEENGNLNGIVEMLTIQGDIYRIMGNYQQSLHFFLLSLEHYQELGNVKGQAAAYNQIGSIFRLQGNYPGAMEHFFNALKKFNQLADTVGIADVLNNIGIVYFYQKNYEKALDYYKQSLSLEQKLNNEFGISVSFINIGEVYQHNRDYKQALDYYLRALVLAKKHEELDGDKDGVGVLYNEIGSIYMHLGDLQLSSTYINNALNIFTGIGSKQRLAECYLNLGQLSMKEAKVDIALSHFSKALLYGQSIGSLDITSKANKFLSEIYDSKNNQSRAYFHFKKYIQARDSLYNEDNTKRTVQAELLYQFEKQMLESKLDQAKKDAVTFEMARRQRLFRNFMSALVLMLLVVVYVTYNAFKSKKKANELLSAQQKQILEKNEELQQQQEEILAQRDEIEQKNRILLHSQNLIEAKNERIISSIEYAQTIQQAILPNEEQLKQYFPDHMIIFLPKDIVSGDFYWFSSIDNLLYAAVIDCTGHGVPGSFMSLIGNTMLNQIINEWQTRDPALILELMHIQVRKALKQDSSNSKAHASMDICLVTIDVQKGNCTFAGASRPLYVIQNGKLEKIPGDPRSVGGFQKETRRYYTNHEIDIKIPTQLYLTTDGYIDQMDATTRKYGPKRLEKTLLENHTRSMNQQKSILISEYEDHKKDCEQIDDICILGLSL